MNLSASGIWISCPVECGRCHGGISDEATDLGTVTEGLGFAPLGPCVSFREGEWDGDGSKMGHLAHFTGTIMENPSPPMGK